MNINLHLYILSTYLRTFGLDFCKPVGLHIKAIIENNPILRSPEAAAFTKKMFCTNDII